MTKKINYVGIDVGSKELVVAMKTYSNSITHGAFDNTIIGHKKLLKFITKNGSKAKICLEATGIYHFDLSVLLANSENSEIMVVNPKVIKHFGTSMRQRAKTDEMDSMIILEYLLRMDFVKWKSPDDNILQIQCYARRLYQLKKQLTQERNRLIVSEFRGNAGKTIKKAINKHIKQLQKLIDEMQLELSLLIQSIPELKQKYDFLISVKGLADISTTQILAEILMFPDGLTAKQWVAFAGLDPKPCESGTSVNKPRRISKRGNKFLRTALYLPALVAIQHEPNVRAYYEKLVTSGKSKMRAIVAVMRKLLLAIWGMLNSGTTWEGNKFYKI